MLRRVEAKAWDDIFLPMGKRPQAGVYFLRLAAYSPAASDFLWQVHEAARQRGAIIDEQLANPDDRQLSYLKDVLGDRFEASASFIEGALETWMPRMRPDDRRALAAALYAEMEELRRRGKTDGILKNLYVKIMCWLYYKFDRLCSCLGDDQPPKALYMGAGITQHELIALRLISALGADVVLAETGGDETYLRLDGDSRFSQLWPVPGGAPFPAGYSLKTLRQEKARPAQTPVSRPAQPQSAPRPAPVDPEKRFPAPRRALCTNAWMQEADPEQLLTPPDRRGSDPGLFYNALIRLSGVQDRLTYEGRLYQLYRKLKEAGRRTVVLDGAIPPATPEEVQLIRRRSYHAPEELIVDLAGNLPASASEELQRLCQRAFVRVMKEEAQAEKNLNRLTVTAVYLLCWIRRYQGQLFSGWKETDVPVLIKTGGCETRAEAAYLRYLSMLPADVMILAPDLSRPCMLKTDLLLDIHGSESMRLTAFPRQGGSLTMGTVASHTQQDLTNLMYGETGLYRSRQFERAEAVILRTTYDEIFLLWDQELSYRPNFSTADHAAHIPVIFSKISGVEKGNVQAYWQKIKLLSEAPGALLYRQLPLVNGASNPYRELAVKSLRGEKLKRADIKNNRRYPFGLLREDMQEHLLDKAQLMLDQRLIRGTFVNGTEYTVIATVLNLSKEILRLIQGFDFTKKNPKIVVINTRDQQASLEDAILMTFLSQVGFDVALFVPTGYQTIERYLNGDFLVEHQAGEYLYDLRAPDFSTVQTGNKSAGWLRHLLRRGSS